jgi:hypothetical protein
MSCMKKLQGDSMLRPVAMKGRPHSNTPSNEDASPSSMRRKKGVRKTRTSILHIIKSSITTSLVFLMHTSEARSWETKVSDH